MYSDHPSVNILTALLVNHGVSHVVVCPGSRNAPIVHNLEQCPHIHCYGVTDERSAGFYALGLAQATGKAAAVCVTSGSALLGVLPAVVEAAFQHVPVVVISADRPGAWIGQLDGQTLPQPDALRGWVRCAVTLPERNDEEGRWHTNRLFNEALTALWRGGGGPVHINVPLSEPLFGFNTPQLPQERTVNCLSARQAVPDLAPLAERWRQARRRMVVVGQLPPDELEPGVMRRIGQEAVIVHEALSGVEGGVAHPDEVVARLSTLPEARPDLIVYLGGTLVSKPLKRYLRTLNDSEQWRVETDGSMPDTFGHLTALIEGAPAAVLRRMAEEMCAHEAGSEEQPHFSHLWLTAENQVAAQLDRQTLPYSQAAVVQYLELQLGSGTGWQTHYANSSAVRLGIRYARHHIWCNRGVNGIEGSISTAAGFPTPPPTAQQRLWRHFQPAAGSGGQSFRQHRDFRCPPCHGAGHLRTVGHRLSAGPRHDKRQAGHRRPALRRTGAAHAAGSLHYHPARQCRSPTGINRYPLFSVLNLLHHDTRRKQVAQQECHREPGNHTPRR